MYITCAPPRVVAVLPADQRLHVTFSMNMSMRLDTVIGKHMTSLDQISSTICWVANGCQVWETVGQQVLSVHRPMA